MNDTLIRGTPVRRLTDTEKNYYLARVNKSRRMDITGFPGLVPLRHGVAGIVVYAHRYITRRPELTDECVAAIWAMIERMQCDENEPLTPARVKDSTQLAMFGDIDDGITLSSRTLVNVLAQTCQLADNEIAGLLGVGLHVIDSVRRGARLSTAPRQALVRLYRERAERPVATMGV